MWRDVGSVVCDRDISGPRLMAEDVDGFMGSFPRPRRNRWGSRLCPKMSPRQVMSCLLLVFVVGGCRPSSEVDSSERDGEASTPSVHEFVREGSALVLSPDDSIQQALDLVAGDSALTTVRLTAGTYRPSRPGQAFVRFLAKHDGVTLEGVGDVTLTAAAPELSGESNPAHPAVVNHVVYFGDGVTPRTKLRAVKITGANGFEDDPANEVLEPASVLRRELQPGMFFYRDGGAIKIFGRSSPTIENVTCHDNHTRLCGAGISVEQRGLTTEPVRITDCIFRENHCPATGVAIDLLQGSHAVIENCLFVGNVGNSGMDEIAQATGLRYKPEHGTGALTVFPGSAARVLRSTFTGNSNGVDDAGIGSEYRDCIFWMNVAGDGSRPGGPFELDVASTSLVAGCFIHGETNDLPGTVNPDVNMLDAPDPEFDGEYRPLAAGYEDVGYRPPSDPISQLPRQSDGSN